jgi:membrane protease YdiL (CAAX protease family)
LPGRLRGQLGLRFDLKKDIPKGILLGIAGQILVAVVYLPLYVFHSDLADKIDDPARQLSEAMSGWRWLVFGFFVGVVSPICEELFFRGLTLKAIAHRWGPVVGIVGSGIVFGIIHFEGLQTIALAAFGMLLAWRATRTGRIGETIIGHGVFNLITVLALITGAS